MAFDHNAHDFPINKRMSLKELETQVTRMINGSTDCALPIKDAIRKNEHVDCFVILTDSQSWSGSQHPAEALKEYRKRFNPNATMVVVAMASNEQSIADPKDSGIINIVGFDSQVMSLITEFARNGGL
jgi:60 kDa SS-A/Ro ribonucleoprotein